MSSSVIDSSVLKDQKHLIWAVWLHRDFIFGSEQKGTDELKTVLFLSSSSIKYFSNTVCCFYFYRERKWRFGIYLLNTGHTHRKYTHRGQKPPCDLICPNWAHNLNSPANDQPHLPLDKVGSFFNSKVSKSYCSRPSVMLTEVA